MEKIKNLLEIYKFIIIFFLIFLILIFYNSKEIKNTSSKKIGRIFDSFMYNNEAEMAYIRIWRLYNFVDKFIILFSNRTFTGIPKNISFAPFEENLKPLMNKVDIVYLGDKICNRKEYPSFKPARCAERSIRDLAKTYIEEHYNLTENDLLLVADIDEIFTKEGIEYVIKNPPKDFYFVKGSCYFPYYYHKVQDWDLVCVIRYNKNMRTLSKYRWSTNITENNTLRYKFNSSKPLVTHCSYCFKNINQYKTKLKSFAHIEFSKPPYTTNNWIFKSHYCRKKLNSPEGYDEPYEGWKDLIPNDSRLKYLIDPSFMFSINETTYTAKDLETLCNRDYRRTPFE